VENKDLFVYNSVYFLWPDLVKSKTGKIVTKKASAAGMKAYQKNGLAKWIASCQKARKQLGVKGFVAIKKGTKLYSVAKSFYKK